MEQTWVETWVDLFLILPLLDPTETSGPTLFV